MSKKRPRSRADRLDPPRSSAEAFVRWAHARLERNGKLDRAYGGKRGIRAYRYAFRMLDYYHHAYGFARLRETFDNMSRIARLINSFVMTVVCRDRIVIVYPTTDWDSFVEQAHWHPDLSRPESRGTLDRLRESIAEVRRRERAHATGVYQYDSIAGWIVDRVIAHMAELARELGCEVRHQFGSILIRIEPTTDLAQAIRQYDEASGVQRAEPAFSLDI